MQTDESRLHLQAAHNRVMSIATVQRHLSAVRAGETELGSYFRQLCESLGASMIRDPDQIQILVRTDAGVVTSDVSLSLGLIVTELVINALKHAFPDERPGRIAVNYLAGKKWTLCVSDNGVGMPSIPPKPGLGTSLIEALAQRLGAHIEVANAKPGTAVSIVQDTGIASPLHHAI
jgi:two-component sensor histidine kinase